MYFNSYIFSGTQILCDSSQYDSQYEYRSDTEKQLRSDCDGSDGERDFRENSNNESEFINDNDIKVELENNKEDKNKLKDDNDVQKQLNENSDIKKQLNEKIKNNDVRQGFSDNINVGQKFKKDYTTAVRKILRCELESDPGILNHYFHINKIT